MDTERERDPAAVHEKSHFHDWIRAMLLAWSILFQSFLLFRFKKVVGTVIIKDSCLTFDQAFACFVEFCLDKRGFLSDYGQSTVYLMQFKLWWFEEIRRLLVTGKFGGGCKDPFVNQSGQDRVQVI